MGSSVGVFVWGGSGGGGKGDSPSNSPRAFADNSWRPSPVKTMSEC